MSNAPGIPTNNPTNQPKPAQVAPIQKPQEEKNRMTDTPTNKKPDLSSFGNKRDRCAALIKAGGATKETLMAALDVDAKGLASQLSYLNTKGITVAEIDPRKAEFPIKGDNGVYRMGSYEDFMAKRPAGFASKDKTPKEAKEFAQKREDQASAKLAKAKERHESDKTDKILLMRYEIAKMELSLATALLAQVESGNYDYESFNVAE